MTWPDAAAPAAEVARVLGLTPLADEGGFVAEGPRAAALSGIRYLLTDAPDGFSALHRLTVAEGWQWLAGAPCELVVEDAGRLVATRLDAATDQLVVPAGTWFGARTAGAWTLVACWCAPRYTDDARTVGDRAALRAVFAADAALVDALTR